MFTPEMMLGVLIAAILSASSAIAVMLSWRTRLATGGLSPTLTNLNSRIVAWWGMAAIMGLVLWSGQTALVLIFAFISFLALREFLALTDTRPADHLALVALFYILLPGQFWLVWSGWQSMQFIYIPAFGLMTLTALSALRGDPDDYLERVSRLNWAALACIFAVSHVPALAGLDVIGHSASPILLVSFLLIVTSASDVLQYICGKLWGRRQMSPQISPNKTVEGLIGGCLGATAVGAALWWITPFTPVQAVGMAALISGAGVLGGLVMSAIKRQHGIKDWGTLLPGHGGILDRIDSLIFAAPVFYHATRYWFT
ncbi:MAG: phosphatidate cytidylyltransferase [Alphaproteobacteria bacterium]